MEQNVLIMFSREHYEQDGEKYETVYDATSGRVRGATHTGPSLDAYKAQWPDAVVHDKFSRMILFKTRDGVLDSIEDQIKNKDLTPKEAEAARQAFEEFSRVMRRALLVRPNNNGEACQL